MKPEPVAKGDLQATPFAHVLCYALHNRLDGTLCVWPGAMGATAGPDRLLLQQGVPVAARWIAQTSLEEGVLALLARTGGPYAFYKENLVGSAPEVVQGAVEPLALIVRAVRTKPQDAVVVAVLKRLGTGAWRLRAGAQIDRFDFSADERACIDRLRSRSWSASELVDQHGDAQTVRRVLYVLAIAKCLEPRAEKDAANPSSDQSRETQARRVKAAPPPVPSMPPPSVATQEASGSRRHRPEQPPAPPDPLEEALRERWEEIVAQAGRLDCMTYFDALGLETSAGAAAAREAYFEKVKRWHPDRLPGELSPLRPWVERVFNYMTEAKNVLAEDESRTEYLRTVKAGGGTPAADRELGAIVGAAMEFPKVEIFVRRREWDAALELIDRVLALSAREADHHAMKGWIVLQRPPMTVESAAEAMEFFERALQLDETTERALYGRGVALKRLGQEAEALECFERVATANPKHLDAVREVRLASMRRAKSQPPQEQSGGLLSRFLKKQK